MKLILVWSWTNDWAGHLNGEASKKCTLAHVASSREEAFKFMEANRAFITRGDQPPSHWVLEKWPLDVDVWNLLTLNNEHYTADLQPCDCYGRVEEVAEEPEEEEDACSCTYCTDRGGDGDCDCDNYDCHGEPEEEERPRGLFLIRQEEGKLPSVDIDEIEKAYEEQAEDKAMEAFSSFANKIADKMYKLADLALDICEELRDEFPKQ